MVNRFMSSQPNEGELLLRNRVVDLARTKAINGIKPGTDFQSTNPNVTSMREPGGELAGGETYRQMVSSAGPMAALAALLQQTNSWKDGNYGSPRMSSQDALSGNLSRLLEAQMPPSPHAMLQARTPAQSPASPFTGGAMGLEDYRGRAMQAEEDARRKRMYDYQDTEQQYNLRGMKQRENGTMDQQYRASTSFQRLMEMVSQLTRGMI